MYAYCNNNPVMYVDPTGEFFLTTTICGVALWKIGLAAVGVLTVAYVEYTLVHNPSNVPSISFPRSRSRVNLVPKIDIEEKDIAVPAIPNRSHKGTVIYRYGGTSPSNLTPSQHDVNLFPITGMGLSFSTIPKPGAAMTTIEELNATGIVYAVKDGPSHVSVFPVGATLEDWHNAGSSSLWTMAVKSVVTKWRE